MWFLKRGVILTKDNLARRNWSGSKVRCFLINLKLSNIFSLIVIMLVLSGVQFIGCLVLPLQQTYLTYLGYGQNWAAANAGQSGSQEMISFLTKVKNKLFYRYCSEGYIGSDSGLNYSAWMSTRLSLWRHAGF